MHTDFNRLNDFPDIDATVEKVLVEAEVAGPVSVCSPSAPVSTNPPLSTMPTSATCVASREACVQAQLPPVYGSLKSDKAVARAMGQEPEQQAFARQKAIQC